VWDRFFTTGHTDETFYLYLGWYGWWDLKRNR
jgi:hypothetical protein